MAGITVVSITTTVGAEALLFPKIAITPRFWLSTKMGN